MASAASHRRSEAFRVRTPVLSAGWVSSRARMRSFSHRTGLASSTVIALVSIKVSLK